VLGKREEGREGRFARHEAHPRRQGSIERIDMNESASARHDRNSELGRDVAAHVGRGSGQHHRHHRPRLRPLAQLEGKRIDNARLGRSHRQPVDARVGRDDHGLCLREVGARLGELLFGRALKKLRELSFRLVTARLRLVELSEGLVVKRLRNRSVAEELSGALEGPLGFDESILGAVEPGARRVDALDAGAPDELVDARRLPVARR